MDQPVETKPASAPAPELAAVEVHHSAHLLRQGRGGSAVALVTALAVGAMLGTPGGLGRLAIGVALLTCAAGALGVATVIAGDIRVNPRFRLTTRRVPAGRTMARLASESDTEVYTTLIGRNPEERRAKGVGVH